MILLSHAKSAWVAEIRDVTQSLLAKTYVNESNFGKVEKTSDGKYNVFG